MACELEMIRMAPSGEICVVDWTNGVRSDWLHCEETVMPLVDYDLAFDLDIDRECDAFGVMRFEDIA